MRVPVVRPLWRRNALGDRFESLELPLAEPADHLVASGFHFYVLDLRKFGRSLREWQTPGYMAGLAVSWAP